MRVVLLSDTETSGGAAVAASRLATGLANAGIDVHRVVGRPDGAGHPWQTHRLDASLRDRQTLQRMLWSAVSPARGEAVHQSQWRENARRRLTMWLEELQPDVINLHNLHGADWPVDLVAICARFAPTVWTLHDQWSFTGRCAYAYDCRKFLTGCDAECPTPREYPALPPPQIRPAWEERRALLDEVPALVAVAPSRWLQTEAAAGLWRGHRVEHIPYGLPLATFAPVERALARDALGIPATGPVLLVAAANVNERRKGGDLLAAALAQLKVSPLTLVTLGRGHLALQLPGLNLVELGFLDHDRLKVLAYSAADLFVHPAPVDNLPNVILEALACGTPCVGFPIGGVPDMVRPGVTGWLADAVTAEALANAIGTALASIQSGRDWRESCRAVAIVGYDERQQANRYLELFSELTRARGANSDASVL
ncbi:MAG: D-inositol-3-phosphate glycosyltransferase [Verrucomicrobiae bacterium]|nr:D-inositol-3-phosphate glycosyltransferase [Verrucomicrobiae bacterium]